MLYFYKKEDLRYVKVKTKYYLIALIITILLSIVIPISYILFKEKEIKHNIYENIIRIEKDKNVLTEEALKEYILSINIRFPDVVYAQAKLETGNLSKVKYNNLFGMRKATVRPTTASGVENGYSYYNSWKESVLDYALYQAAYLSQIHSREEYLQYLQKFYAEDTSYISKINKICNGN
mgnify:CR=1 FL=1